MTMLWLSFLALLASGGAYAQCTLSASGGDDSPQFLAAVKACSLVSIPKATTLNIATRLDMTGLSNVNIDLAGTIRFNDDLDYWTDNAFMFDFQDQAAFWLLGGTNVTLTGGGILDGNGQAWYDAFEDDDSTIRPIVLTVYQGSNVVVKNIKMIDAPEWFNLVYESDHVVFDNITLDADTDTHNTDGWDTYRSDSVTIQNSVITNGDDCVSFKPNSTNIFVSNLTCDGSHGISVGSLGQYPEFYDIVENVTAINVKMSNAQNGARIKAWAGTGVGSGIVRNITFTNFTNTKVTLPMVIDQCYMTSASACSANPSNTFIEDVWFNGISGKSSAATVASLLCSPGQRCGDINVNDITLTPGSGTAKYLCQNVNLLGNSASLFPTCTTT